MLPKYVEEWENAIRDKAFYKLIIILLGLALIANGYFRSYTAKVMVYPPELKRKFWMTPAKASREYLEQMALAFLHFTLDLNPENADSFVKYVIDSLEGEKAGEISQSLLTDARYIMDNEIYQVFYPATVSVNQNEVIVAGNITRKVAGKEVMNRDVHYRIVFRIKNYGIAVTDLGPYDPRKGNPED